MVLTDRLKFVKQGFEELDKIEDEFGEWAPQLEARDGFDKLKPEDIVTISKSLVDRYKKILARLRKKGSFIREVKERESWLKRNELMVEQATN